MLTLNPYRLLNHPPQKVQNSRLAVPCPALHAMIRMATPQPTPQSTHKDAWAVTQLASSRSVAVAGQPAKTASPAT